MKGPILLVDAFEESLQALAAGLAGKGYQTVTARTPGDPSVAGLAMAPKIAVVDVDGLDDEMIADMPRLKQRWPHMGVIALAQPQRDKTDTEMLAGARAAGAHFLSMKPVSHDDLARRIEDLLRKGFGAKRKPMALVVDDSETIGEILKAYLRKRGYDSVVKPTWEQALAGWDTLGADIVITDIFMPGMGGVEGIKYVREHWGHLPVVAISGGLDTRMTPDDALLAAKKMGADAAISKPISERQVVDALTRLLPAF
jgi:DNA-binding response OmpR family regulator